MTKSPYQRSSLVALAPVLLVLGGGLFDSARAQGQCPCDSMSGQGKATVTASGGKASFGFTGGVRQGAFWGDLVYQDYELGLNVQGTGVTGYSATGPRTRVIQGTATTNLYGNRTYRITATDNGGTFQIDLDNGYSRQGTLTSGKITLHNGNRNSTPPPGYTCAAPVDTTPPTVTITSPTSGSTVSGTITVSANAWDDGWVAGVQFELDGAPLGAEVTKAPYSISWNTTTAANGGHTLTAVARDGANNIGNSAPVSVTVLNVFTGPDVFVALTNGQVQWRNSAGVLLRVLIGNSAGQASSLNFDVAHNLYVPHWWGPVGGLPGNTIERFDANGNFILGTFGSGYNCDPSSVAFDALGNVYVGQADCTGNILKFDPAGNPVATFNVLVTNRGTDHIDLASDGCTIFYSSRDKNIYRYNVCTHTQLPNFNLQPLPGLNAYHLRILSDGGVLVADSEMIARLDAAGNLVQTYNVPGESGYLWGGVDYVGDGTFWASNGYSSNIYRFNIQSGAVVASFNTDTGNLTAAGVAVKR